MVEVSGMGMYKVSNPKKVKKISDAIIKDTTLTKGDLFAIATKITASTEGIKDYGHNITVRDFGDENIAVKNAGINKGFDEIDIYLNNPGNDAGENRVLIYPETNKKGKIKEFRVVVRAGDDYYYDESSNQNLIIVKHLKEPTDYEIESKRYKPKHEYPHGKSMPRILTDAESVELLAFAEANPKMDILQVIDIFEEKFGTLITEHFISSLIIQKQLFGEINSLLKKWREDRGES
jgi:hypothetical protein